MAQKFANAARSVLAANITDVATSLTVDIALADLFPVADTDTDPIPTVGKDYFKAVLQNTSGDIEIVYVRTRALGSATFSNMIRGQEGTTAIAFLAGSIVGLRHTAEDLADAIDLAAGATVSGKALLNAASVAAQRTALGVTVTGDAVFTAADKPAARAAIGQRTGDVNMWPVSKPPSDALICDGSAVSRATYADLFAVLVRTATVTASITSPGVIGWTAHGLSANDPVKFSTTGALPTGLVAGTTYYAVSASITANTFQVSATPGGAAINFTGSQSGTHTGIHAPHGDGNGSTTFNLPNPAGRMMMGAGSAYPAGATGGSKDAVVVSHGHTATSTDAGHVHGVDGFATAGGTGVDTGTQSGGKNTAAGFANITTTVSTEGVSGVNANLPPYLGIYFIINT